MSDWYNNIEEPIRAAVKLLRDNGFNTTCSCGHSMEIDFDPVVDGEFKRLHDLLYGEGFSNYTITFRLICKDGCVYPSASIKLCP